MQENKDDPSNSKNNDGKINRKEISTNFIILSHNKIINNAEVLYKDGSNNLHCVAYVNSVYYHTLFH